MIRRLAAVLAALVCLAASGLAAAPAQARTVTPRQGSYVGADQQGRHVAFSLVHASRLWLFTLNGHHFVGGAPVSGSTVPETCHDGVCFKGQWTSETTASGAWRYAGSSTWTAWQALYTELPAPHVGSYRGVDHSGRQVQLTFDGTLVTVRIGDHIMVATSVRYRTFEVCHPHVCIRGRWNAVTYVVGSWRLPSSSTWTAWEAHAHSS